jgi:dGTPase
MKKEFVTTEDILAEYRQLVEQKEEQTLHPRAAFSKNHSRFFGSEIDHRLPYKRDVDRIVHSKAYARYIDKTQVVYLVNNDHITHRGLHVQLVSNFARGIAEILRLNLDLVEAISLGHDVGHPPFGHEGEGYLSVLTEQYLGHTFAHPWQSCRLFTVIEPLNLGLHVYDGFLCHDGGLTETKLEPRFGKTWEDHIVDLGNKLKDPNQNMMPGTIEGCLVKLCDTMSYVGKDIEDAITVGILERDQVPRTILGTTNREILSVLARDIIKMSYGKDYISISQNIFDALHELREFNFKMIYQHPRLKVESEKIKRSYRLLFEILFEDLQNNQRSSHVWKAFCHNKSDKYLQSTPQAQMIIDYIAGMTDNYFVRLIEKLTVPQRIELS